MGTVIESHSRQVQFCEDVSVFVGVQVVIVDGNQKSVFGKMEFNPSRIVDPNGFGLASLMGTIDALREMVRIADFLVVPMYGSDLSSYRVKRIDLAKDFHAVNSTSALVRGLATFPRKHVKKNFVHADPILGGAQTLTVGSNAGMVRLYDKHVQAAGGVEPGTVRWEVQARSAWAKSYGGIRTVGDLSESNVTQLSLNRWEWSGMGSEVVRHLDVSEIAARLGIKEAEASTFYGWLVDRSLSSGWRPSPTTLAKFRKYQRELGVTFGLESLLSNSVSVRLDWESATEVLRSKGDG
jgi:hypothetical protein